MNKSRELEKIVSQFSRSLYVYIYRFTRNREEAEDILQEVFLKVYQNLDRYDQNRKLKPWLYRIAHNEAINHIRKNARLKLTTLDGIENSLNFSKLEAGIFENEKRENFNRALNSLADKEKQVFSLRFLGDKTVTEIAGLLGIKPNFINVIIFRARKKLKKNSFFPLT